MLLALLYSLLRLLLDALLVRDQSAASLQSEVLLLRHQLRVLQRQVRRPRWQPSDRLLLASLSRRLPRTAWASFLVRPETILRWHRELVRRKWAAFGGRPRRRHGPPTGDQGHRRRPGQERRGRCPHARPPAPHQPAPRV